MSQRRREQSGTPVLQAPQPRSVRGGPQATERRLAGAREVPLDQVLPDPRQPRKDWGHAEGEVRLEELTASIREFGILQPLLVFEDGTLEDGRQCYRIIAGGRRRLAAEHAGLSLLPVVVREATDRLRYEQLQENLQRQDLSPLDEARAFQELLDLGQQSPPTLAARLCVSAQHVRDRLRLLTDQVLADAVERRQISASAAREIMKLPDDEMLAFRARVAGGETLQTNDVATARARLAAAGSVHARRKGSSRPVHSSAPRAVALPRASAASAPVPHSPTEARQDPTPQPPVERAAPATAPEAARTTPAPEPPLSPPRARDQLRALLAGRSQADHLLLGQVLAIGTAEGWSCARLQQELADGRVGQHTPAPAAP
jgi:ParB family chromosome partitioning protein